MPVLPYVYLCTHKETGQFYIGSRLANKVPAQEDLGLVYKTSSKRVKPIFHEFSYFVYAEFFNPEDAWEFEQRLIEENISNTLILNLSYYREGSVRFHTLGRVRPRKEVEASRLAHLGVKRPNSRTPEVIDKWREARKGWKPSKESVAKRVSSFKGYVPTNETRQKMSEAHKGLKHTSESLAKMKGRIISETTKLKMGESRRGATHTLETKLKMSAIHKGNTRRLGKKYCHNPMTKERNFFFPNEIPEGWLLGALKN